MICRIGTDRFHGPGIGTRDSRINSGSISPGTSKTPRHDSDQCRSFLGLSLVGVTHERTARVTLTGILTLPSGTDVNVLAIVKATNVVQVIVTVAILNVRNIDFSQEMRRSTDTLFVLPSVSQRRESLVLDGHQAIPVHGNGTKRVRRLDGTVGQFYQFHIVPLSEIGIVVGMILNPRHGRFKHRLCDIGMTHTDLVAGDNVTVGGTQYKIVVHQTSATATVKGDEPVVLVGRGIVIVVTVGYGVAPDNAGLNFGRKGGGGNRRGQQQQEQEQPCVEGRRTHSRSRTCLEPQWIGRKRHGGLCK